jgi:hypothetical protein
MIPKICFYSYILFLIFLSLGDFSNNKSISNIVSYIQKNLLIQTHRSVFPAKDQRFIPIQNCFKIISHYPNGNFDIVHSNDYDCNRKGFRLTKPLFEKIIETTLTYSLYAFYSDTQNFNWKEYFFSKQINSYLRTHYIAMSSHFCHKDPKANKISFRGTFKARDTFEDRIVQMEDNIFQFNCKKSAIDKEDWLHTVADKV